MNKTKTCVAIVDDDESFARALDRLFRASGFEVRIYLSGEAFLVAKALPEPDCLVLDIQLGGMSGLDLLRELRKLGILAPAIFVTAHDAPEVRAEAEQFGCIAYLLKPVVSKLLMDAVAKAMHPGGTSSGAS
jgi:FixJ family two-component response regulator